MSFRISMLLAWAVVAMLPTAVSVQAKSGCATAANQPNFEAGDVIASCSKDRKICRISMIAREKGASAALPNVLSLARQTGTKNWAVALGSARHRVDTSDGLQYRVDVGEPQRIPPEFLSTVQLQGAAAKNFKSKTYVDQKLASIVRDDLIAGKTVTWSVKIASGETKDITFSTVGLDLAASWIDCKQ